MTRFSILTATVASLIALLACPSAQAGITFGTGANQFDMEFVPIGIPGNADDTTGWPNPAGSVAYTFNMGKYEVSRDMITKANAAGGLGITLADMSAFGGNGANKPATGMSWFEAAKFVNWLNTSQGHQAAYNFDVNGNFQLWSSADAWQLGGENLFRHKDAVYWLPSMDEWYKAAYYDPTSASYFDYPTGNDSAPTAAASGTTAGTAVYAPIGGYIVGPADITLAGGLSPYGTMGQGGNVWEWQETEWDLSNNLDSPSRGYRGGSWNLGVQFLHGGVWMKSIPDNYGANLGFRVAAAAVPEPGSLAVWGLIGLCGLLYRGRRGRK